MPSKRGRHHRSRSFVVPIGKRSPVDGLLEGKGNPVPGDDNATDVSTEHGTSFDARRFHPSSQRPHGTRQHARAEGNADNDPAAFLVGLAPPQLDQEPVIREGDAMSETSYDKARQLRAPHGGAKTNQQQS
jgi:hypothetical protein